MRAAATSVAVLLTRAIWISTGVSWIATGIAYQFGPSYSVPETVLDRLSIVLFSGSLVLMAAGLWAIVRAASPGRWTAALGGLAAASSALAGIANLLEDGFGLRWFANPFFAGMLLLAAASIGFATALATTHPGFRLAALPACLAVAPFAMGDAGPGKLLDGALWLALGLWRLR